MCDIVYVQYNKLTIICITINYTDQSFDHNAIIINNKLCYNPRNSNFIMGI